MKVKIVKDILVFEQMPPLIQGDDQDITFLFRHDDETIFDLTNYDEVRFKARLTNEAITKINKTAVISSDTSGIAILSLTTSDLASSGVYFTEISVSSTTEIRTTDLGKLFLQEEL